MRYTIINIPPVNYLYRIPFFVAWQKHTFVEIIKSRAKSH